MTREDLNAMFPVELLEYALDEHEKTVDLLVRAHGGWRVAMDGWRDAMLMIPVGLLLGYLLGKP